MSDNTKAQAAEPVAWERRSRLPDSDKWGDWQSCTKMEFDFVSKTPVTGWLVQEVRALYAAPAECERCKELAAEIENIHRIDGENYVRTCEAAAAKIKECDGLREQMAELTEKYDDLHGANALNTDALRIAKDHITEAEKELITLRDNYRHSAAQHNAEIAALQRKVASLEAARAAPEGLLDVINQMERFADRWATMSMAEFRGFLKMLKDALLSAAPQSAAPNLVSVVRAHCDDLRQVVPTLRAHKMFATADEVEKAISELVAAAPAKPVPESAANDLAIMLRRMIRFANKLDGDREIKVIAGNAAELLRRYELQGSPLRAKAAPVPLSDAEIDIALLHEGYMLAGEKQFFKRGIRFAEQHHGITPPAQGEQG